MPNKEILSGSNYLEDGSNKEIPFMPTKNFCPTLRQVLAEFQLLGGWNSQDGRIRGFHDHGDRFRLLRIGLWDPTPK